MSLDAHSGSATNASDVAPPTAHGGMDSAELGTVIGSEVVDILIVDDEPEVLIVLKRQMQRKGYSVRTAGNAFEAAAELASCRPRVILLDLMMPRIDGEGFLRNLREAHSPGALPVIVVTASNQRADMLRCLDAGANDFVTKPVDLDALTARVELQIAVGDQFRVLEKNTSLYTDGATCAHEALWEWGPDNGVFNASANLATVCGLPAQPKDLDEWIAGLRAHDGQALMDQIESLREKRAIYVEQHVRADGDAPRALLVRARLETEGDAEIVKGAVVDVTEPYLRDGASGLAAGHAFLDRLAERHEQGSPAHVILFDAQRFDELTFAHGIARGDHALQIYLSAVKRAAASIGDVYRLGQSEFAIIGEPDVSPGEMRSFARDIASGHEFGVQVREGRIHRIASSVGVVIGSTEEPKETLFRARLALRAAADAGAGRTCEYSDELRDVRLRQARIEARLSGALERDAITASFQPLVDVASGRWVGVEALPEWRDDELGVIPSQEFIACADRIGCSLELFEMVARRALHAGHALSKCAREPLFVAINAPAGCVTDPGLARTIARLGRDERFEPSNIVLEVSEDDILCNYEACAAAFQELNKIGVRVAIDDFGSSYSCLSYLCRVPSQILKFDEAMVNAAFERPDARTLLGTTSRMAKHLDKSVVLNGVSQAEQMQIAREVGADMAQGSLTSKPMTTDELLIAYKALR